MVSVVMASYNGREYIIEQMNSIRCQTQPPDEVIICDDGSTDRTLDIIEAYINKWNLRGWKIIRNSSNKGYFNNFFYAISLAKGKNIYLADQDDLWDLNKIKSFELLYASEAALMMIQSNVEFIDGENNHIGSRDSYHGKKMDIPTIELTTQDMCKFAGSGFTMSFRSAVSNKIFEKSLQKEETVFVYHDILLGLMSAAMGRCILCPNVKDKHRLHHNNATQKKNKVSYSERTKKKQIEILLRRVCIFSKIADSCADKKKRRIFIDYSSFADSRMDYIRHFSLKKVITLLKKRNMYYSAKGIIVDTMYALGMEKVLLFIFSNL